MGDTPQGSTSVPGGSKLQWFLQWIASFSARNTPFVPLFRLPAKPGERPKVSDLLGILLVGAPRFELGTPSPPVRDVGGTTHN
jgi:hypothetical protein